MKRVVLYLFVLFCVLSITGCQKHSETEKISENISKEENIYSENVKIASVYQDIYKEFYLNNTLETLDAKSKIAERLAQNGYVVSDTENRINMHHYELAEQFCDDAKQRKEAEVTILLLKDDGGFIRYDLATSDGQIFVALSVLFWDGAEQKSDYYEEFTAFSWKYTDKGYLFIEQYRPAGYDGAPGQIGIRIKPLDQTLRNLNEKYVSPVGYIRNNLLITNWSEEDYGALEFYDLYEIMYRLKYGTYVPYESGIGGNEYFIPEKDFEEVIQNYFSISDSALRTSTVFIEEKSAYRYRPRGLYDAEYPYEPYPEVVDYQELSDGQIKLIVEAVWIYENNDCAIKSELIVKPLDNDKFEYVSNSILTTDDSIKATWYQPRLTDKEWAEIYGGTK